MLHLFLLQIIYFVAHLSDNFHETFDRVVLHYSLLLDKSEINSTFELRQQIRSHSINQNFELYRLIVQFVVNLNQFRPFLLLLLQH